MAAFTYIYKKKHSVHSNSLSRVRNLKIRCYYVLLIRNTDDTQTSNFFCETYTSTNIHFICFSLTKVFYSCLHFFAADTYNMIKEWLCGSNDVIIVIYVIRIWCEEHWTIKQSVDAKETLRFQQARHKYMDWQNLYIYYKLTLHPIKLNNACCSYMYLLFDLGYKTTME